jgi:UPF0755 protein
MQHIRSIIAITFWVILAFILGLGASYWWTLSRPLGNDQTVTINVSEGEGARAIAAKLKEQGLLKDERPFLIYALLSGKRSKLYPGTYTLPAKTTLPNLINTLSDPASRQIKVTILEGWRITDIAAEIAAKTSITKEAFLAAAPVATYEGYLFPDTYYFTSDTTAEQAVKTMRDTFTKRTQDLGLTPTQVILASIVERESGSDSDREQVAGVYQNRLDIDMALEADPTVQYGKGSWNPITLADYRNTISPYNTYLHKGLPPTPIASAGLASLKAAKNPADHQYYYFFHTGDGKTIFSKNLAEHNANKQKYLY